MVYQVSDVVRDVRVAVDENRESAPLMDEEDVDTLSLDEIVRSKVLDAVARVHAEAPVYLLEGGHTFGDALYWGDKESGWVLLPDDFMRLMVFEMSDWEKAVYSAISTEDPEYARQRQRVKALRGTAQKPVCAIGIRPEGRVLEFYSCKSEDAYVKRAQYLPYPEIDEYGGIDISEHCYRGVVYMAAALVAAATGEGDKVTLFTELSKSALR